MDDMTEQPLPGMPEPVPAAEPSTRPGFHRYSGPHALCAACVRDLHRHPDRLPFPRPARWVHVREDGSTDLLCPPCKEEQQ